MLGLKEHFKILYTYTAIHFLSLSLEVMCVIT